MKHKLHKCNDPECFTCKGDLASCDECFGAEGSLPTDCPGLRLNQDTLDAIYNKILDYKEGQWIKLRRKVKELR